MELVTELMNMLKHLVLTHFVDGGFGCCKGDGVAAKGAGEKDIFHQGH